MSIELIIFLVMVGTFMAGCFAAKLPVSVSMVLASVAGALVGGHGIPVRHLVEGTFAYIDTILTIATAMIFMKVVEKSGALDALSSLIIEKFHKVPSLLLILVMLVIMFPGMITGSSTASVLSAGSIMVPILLLLGIPKMNVGAIIAMGGILGMIAPPTNVPAMMICGGVDMPYVGFTLPLAILTFPLAIIFVLMLGYKYVRKLDYSLIEGQLDKEIRQTYGVKIYLPIITLAALMLVDSLIPSFPDVGTPVLFLIAAFVGLFSGKKFNLLETAKDAVKDVLPVMGILMGVGMFIQIMTLTGVRGLIVNASISMPGPLLYAAMGITIPAFGAISAFGAASVLGVPFTLAMISGNQVLIVAALSLISGAGDMVPPTALAGIFAAQVVDEPKYVRILKKSVIPVVLMIVYGLIFIIWSKPIGSFLGI
jgi:TRAP-type C4-dicarboxylate transport system permease large subunit